MTADYASALKRAWGGTGCHPICRAWDGDGAYCKGHAALLDMVDEYSLRLPGPRKRQYTDKERRRLRAAVGVEE